ncbi:MAG: AAA family ATPase, partial [Bradymonadaceae bacterium]
DAAAVLSKIQSSEQLFSGGGRGEESAEVTAEDGEERDTQPEPGQRITTTISVAADEMGLEDLFVDIDQYSPPPGMPKNWRFELPDRRSPRLVGAGLNMFEFTDVPVVGRQTLRDEMWSTLKTVHEQNVPRCLVLSGPTGTGKTRVVRWLSDRAHELGVGVPVSVFHGPHETELRPLRRMVESFFAAWQLDHDRVEESIANRLEQLGIASTAMADGGVELAEGLADIAQPSADEVDPEAYRAQALAALSQLVEQLVEVRTPVVCLDDVAYGAESLRWVEQLLDRPDPPGVLLVLTVDDDVTGEAGAEQLLDRIRQRAMVSEHEVGPLPSADLREFLDRLMVMQAALADRVVEASQGSPLYARELLQDWVAREFLQTGADGFELIESRSPVFPDGLTTLYQRRQEWFVTNMETIERDHVELALEAGVALGRTIDRQAWEATCRRLGIPEVGDVLLSELTEAGIAEWYPSGWRFRHGLIARVLEQRSRQFGRWSKIRGAIPSG